MSLKVIGLLHRYSHKASESCCFGCLFLFPSVRFQLVYQTVNWSLYFPHITFLYATVYVPRKITFLVPLSIFELAIRYSG
jgi:hypothetical protein